nr:MAG TPA: hypothetical protein [Caudoviricetes sp.]
MLPNGSLYYTKLIKDLKCKRHTTTKARQTLSYPA